MNEVGTDAAGRLWWAVKRYRWLVALVVVATAVFGATQGSQLLADGDEPVYEATALVVAAQLEVRPEFLPKTAVAIFEGGAVAASVVEQTGVGIRPEALMPEHVRIDPVEDSVVLEIEARHPEPAMAALLANVAAEAFVTEMNRPGELLGRFVVQETAARPDRPEPRPGPVLPTAIGLFAGLAFALGLVGLYVSLRRPVLLPSEAAEVAGAVVLGAPSLPSGMDLEPTRVAGLTALLKRIFPARQETVVVVGVRGDRGERSSLAMLLARGLARTGPVYLVSDANPPERMPPDERRNVRLATALEVDQRTDALPAVIDGPTAEGLDVPQFLPADARVVLVVREGTSSRALESAAAQFLPGELLGILFVPVTRASLRPIVDNAPGLQTFGGAGDHDGSGPEGPRPRVGPLDGPFARVAADEGNGPEQPSRSSSPRPEGGSLEGPFARVADEAQGNDRPHRPVSPRATAEPPVYRGWTDEEADEHEPEAPAPTPDELGR